MIFGILSKPWFPIPLASTLSIIFDGRFLKSQPASQRALNTYTRESPGGGGERISRKHTPNLGDLLLARLYVLCCVFNNIFFLPVLQRGMLFTETDGKKKKLQLCFFC